MWGTEGVSNKISAYFVNIVLKIWGEGVGHLLPFLHVSNALLQKHPAPPLDTSIHVYLESSLLSEEDVARAIKSFPNGSAFTSISF